MTLDGQTIKTKVVDLEELYNFIVNNFFILNHLFKENYVWISHILNSKFSNDLECRNDKKIVDLEKLYNFVVQNIFTCM